MTATQTIPSTRLVETDHPRATQVDMMPVRAGSEAATRPAVEVHDRNPGRIAPFLPVDAVAAADVDEPVVAGRLAGHRQGQKT
ncbi:hypothetical protein GCM10009773_05520 [Williamsia serinedens]